MFNKLTPNMMVEDVRKTVEFYRNVFGFDFVMAVPKNSQNVLMEMPEDQILAYAMVKNNDVEIMFQAKESLSEDVPSFKGVNIGASVSFYFDVSDVTALYETLKENTEVVKALHTTWYGVQEFYLKDCNGYILGFSEQTQSS